MEKLFKYLYFLGLLLAVVVLHFSINNLMVGVGAVGREKAEVFSDTFYFEQRPALSGEGLDITIFENNKNRQVAHIAGAMQPSVDGLVLRDALVSKNGAEVYFGYVSDDGIIREVHAYSNYLLFHGRAVLLGEFARMSYLDKGYGLLAMQDVNGVETTYYINTDSQFAPLMPDEWRGASLAFGFVELAMAICYFLAMVVWRKGE